MSRLIGVRKVNRPRHPRLLSIAAKCIVCAGLAAAPSFVTADDDLTRDLLGDLENDLRNDLAKPPTKPASGETKQIENNRAAGEDIGAPPSTENPLAKIMRQMRLVEQRIAEADSTVGTQQMQTRVLVDLSELIRQLQAQKSKQKTQSKPKDAKAGKTAASKPSDKPSEDSTDRLDKAKNKDTDSLAPDQLVKEVWGHLPQQIVEQMTRQSVDKFLPKYEQLIEDYFRSLAESSRDD
jgi:hypothetical protein